MCRQSINDNKHDEYDITLNFDESIYSTISAAQSSFTVVFIVCFVANLFVNIVLLVATLGDPELRRGALGPLAVTISLADLLFTLSGVAFRVTFAHVYSNVATFTTSELYAWHLILHALFFGTTASGVTSLYSLIAVSIEQYSAVVHPLRKNTRIGNPLKRSLTRVALTIVIAILVSIPSQALCQSRGSRFDDRTAANVTFVNLSNFTANIYWHNFKGTIHRVDKQLDNGHNHTQPSNVNHAWSFRDNESSRILVTSGGYDVYFSRGVQGGEIALIAGERDQRKLSSEITSLGWAYEYTASINVDCYRDTIYECVVFGLVPILLIGFFYGRTVYTLLCRDPKLGDAQQRQKKRKAASMIVTLEVVLVLTLAPPWVVHIVFQLQVVSNIRVRAVIVGFFPTLLSLTGLLAPLLLCVMSEKHRVRLLAVARRTCCGWFFLNSCTNSRCRRTGDVVDMNDNRDGNEIIALSET